MLNIISRLLLALSNIEAFFSSPGANRLILRRIFMRTSRIEPPDRFWIGHSFFLMHRGRFTIGKRCAIGERSTIANHAKITIGDDFMSAGGLVLNSGSHDTIDLTPQCMEIQIGNRVWCGQNVTVLSGVSIGDDVVIGACSLVTKSIPANSIAMGVPARIVRNLSRNKITDLWSWASKG
jgi:acetyltransferase-like isoleucine patch superfamily enzyme